MFAELELKNAPRHPARLAERLPGWLELPVYRTRLRSRGARPDFAQLPFITKQDMRDGFPGNFLRAGQELERLLAEEQVELEHTSGTSEERTPVLLARGWWAEQEARALRLNRVVACALASEPAGRRVVLTTPQCNGLVCESRWAPVSARVQGEALGVNLARIPFLLTPAELERMAAETADWAPLFLDVDPVHGAWFARFCAERGLRFPSLRFVVCSYEFVSVVHRRLLERAFGVPVLNLYGSTETGHLLMEDEQGVLRPSLETAFLEVMGTDAAGVGDLVVTTLSNEYMPLLRYRIGDLIERRREGGTGYVVHGRARDALQAADGRRVTTWQVDQCFSGLPGFAHYELRQDRQGALSLRFVPEGDGPQAADLRLLAGRLEALFEARAPIPTEPTDVLAPAVSGKFRLTYRATA